MADVTCLARDSLALFSSLPPVSRTSSLSLSLSRSLSLSAATRYAIYVEKYMC